MQTPNLDEIKKRLANNPSILLEKLSHSTHASHAQLVECLPESMWTKIDGQYFTEILSQITTWGAVTTIMHTDDVIMEYLGDFPEGTISHGFYNLTGSKNGLHGHLKYTNCKAIYFVEKPYNGVETKSILFTNQEGLFMFKIFLGRDEQGQIKVDQIKLFKKMTKDFKQKTDVIE